MVKVVFHEIFNIELFEDIPLDNSSHFLLIDTIIVGKHSVREQFGKDAQVRMDQKNVGGAIKRPVGNGKKFVPFLKGYFDFALVLGLLEMILHDAHAGKEYGGSIAEIVLDIFQSGLDRGDLEKVVVEKVIKVFGVVIGEGEAFFFDQYDFIGGQVVLAHHGFILRGEDIPIQAIGADQSKIVIVAGFPISS
jgi:hypothetical protein